MGEDGVFDFDKPLVPDQEDEERLKDNLGGMFDHLNEQILNKTTGWVDICTCIYVNQRE